MKRRAFLIALPAACVAAEQGKGRVSVSKPSAYPDPSTEFSVLRLTDPSFTSLLPAPYGRPVARKGNALLFSCDAGGTMQAYRFDYRNGEVRQLTDAAELQPLSLTHLADERSFAYVDGGRLFVALFSSLKAREVYRAADGFQLVPGSSIADDGLYAAVIERKDMRHRLRLVRMADGVAITLAEGDDEIHDPIPRPRRASALYRRGKEVWLANYDAQQNYRLKTTEGEISAAVWSPDGRGVLYLNTPADRHKLIEIREYTPDTNEDKAVADTTQYAAFARNGDASVFVGASGSKASPHVLLLIRAVRRELILCEHRASDPRMVSPVFSPNSQRIFFNSDQHGKPAIYSMPVDKLVSETGDDAR